MAAHYCIQNSTSSLPCFQQHTNYYKISVMQSSYPCCALLTGCYWVSITDGGQWTTSGRSFVIPDIFCDHAVYVSIWVMEVEDVQVKFVSRQVYMEFTISGNTLRSIALPCEKGNWIKNVTSAYSMTSSADVAVYIEYSFDDVMVRPLASLGTNFFVPALIDASSSSQGAQENFVAITSVSDKTGIELRFPAPNATQPHLGSFKRSNNGEFYTINLDKFRTALMSSAVSFSGSRIRGSADLLILVGTIRQGRTVLMIDQLPAVENYGKEYFLYVPDWIQDGITVYASGLGRSTNFTFQTKLGKSEFSLDEFGNSSFHVSKGDYAFIQSIDANVGVTRHEPARYNPNDTLVSIEPPLTHYTNLANSKPPKKEPNDSYVLVTSVLENCNHLHRILNLPGLISAKNFTNISGRIFSVYQTFNDTWLETIVNDTKLLGGGLLSRVFIFRHTRGIFRTYPFPVHSIPVITCPDVTLKPTSTLTSSLAAASTTRTTPWLPNYLHGNGVDDDCDGRTDEELLNGKDDDGDGSVDEDIVFGCWESGKDAGSTPGYGNTSVETVDIPEKLHFHPSNSYYHASVVSLVVSLAIALWAAAMLLGGSLLWEYHRRLSARRSTSVSPIIED